MNDQATQGQVTTDSPALAPTGGSVRTVRPKLMGAIAAAAMLGGVLGLSPTKKDASGKPRQMTKYDLEALEKARLKRERKAAKKAQNDGTEP